MTSPTLARAAAPFLALLVACAPTPQEPSTKDAERSSGEAALSSDDVAIPPEDVERSEGGRDEAEVGQDEALDDADLEIVDIVPKDAIPAIDAPRFWAVDEADEVYDDDTLVLGVAFDGDARAYHVPFLSRHEIVNDTVGDRAISVTW